MAWEWNFKMDIRVRGIRIKDKKVIKIENAK